MTKFLDILGQEITDGCMCVRSQSYQGGGNYLDFFRPVFKNGKIYSSINSRSCIQYPERLLVIDELEYQLRKANILKDFETLGG